MTIWTFNGNPNGNLVATPGDTGFDILSGPPYNYFVCQGGSVWGASNFSGGPSGAWAGVVTGSVSPAAGPGTVAWVVPNLANLYTYVEAGVVAVANVKDLAPGQADRFSQAMVDTVAKIRGMIGGVPGYVVSATANSIPPELMDHCVKLILLAMQGAYPALGLTEDQKKAFEDSRKVIDSIKPDARGWCWFKPSMPPDPATGSQQGSPAARTVRHTPRSMTARSLSGLTLGVGRGDCGWEDGGQLQ